MYCRCGCAFCYSCGLRFAYCLCYQTEEEDIIEDEFRVEYVHQMAGHQNYTTVREKGQRFACALCAREYRNWVLRCEECLLLVCNRCREDHGG